MRERSLEILVSRAIRQVFGPNYELIARQLSLPNGRLDLLIRDSDGQRYVVEIKKGAATKPAVDQVRQYLRDFETDGGILAVGWIVAHEIPAQVEAYAGSFGVRTTAVSLETCRLLMGQLGICDADLLGKRLRDGILAGGGVRWKNGSSVDFESAMAALPQLHPDQVENLLNLLLVRAPKRLIARHQARPSVPG